MRKTLLSSRDMSKSNPNLSKARCCASCRMAKKRCSQDRPACTYCSAHGHVCVYPDHPLWDQHVLQYRSARRKGSSRTKRRARLTTAASSSARNSATLKSSLYGSSTASIGSADEPPPMLQHWPRLPFVSSLERKSSVPLSQYSPIQDHPTPGEENSQSASTTDGGSSYSDQLLEAVGAAGSSAVSPATQVSFTASDSGLHSPKEQQPSHAPAFSLTDSTPHPAEPVAQAAQQYISSLQSGSWEPHIPSIPQVPFVPTLHEGPRFTYGHQHQESDCFPRCAAASAPASFEEPFTPEHFPFQDSDVGSASFHAPLQRTRSMPNDPWSGHLAPTLGLELGQPSPSATAYPLHSPSFWQPEPCLPCPQLPPPQPTRSIRSSHSVRDFQDPYHCHYYYDSPSESRRPSLMSEQHGLTYPPLQQPQAVYPRSIGLPLDTYGHGSPQWINASH